MEKILIAMSGGVDSSVAAFLMKEQGFDCVGVTMKLFGGEELGIKKDHSCCSLDDVEDARSVAMRLGIPYYVFNFSDRFRECVIDRFIGAYENGETPNPCIDCNRFLKFDALFRRARELGCERIATGHYANIRFDEASGRYLLEKAADASKDQSYVLWSMTQEQLAHTSFPLGSFKKEETRRIAEQNEFINAQKHDSQDICFVPDGDYAAFVEQTTGKTYPQGDFLTEDGKKLGKHKGLIHYTVGQRRGLGLALPEPLYVVRLDLEHNNVILGRNEALFSRELTANEINLIAVPKLEMPRRLKAKVRYRQREEWATVEQTANDTLRVVFDEPQRAITKGQSVVLYDGDVVFGGGIIKETE
ncbi:MAG: tRNA 2-thiouridine(34) synthase MnmA [Clostridia bacterium]|nr:tRNA 2-thiouridine(34) synthase MnmA [Clostridia bacterium]